MLEGFIVGLVVWSAPAVIAWLVAGPFLFMGRHPH